MPEKQKRKHRRESRYISNVPFVLQWALSYGLAWGVVHGVGIYLERTIPYFWDYHPVKVNMYILGSFAFLTVAIAWSQQWLLNRRPGHSFEGWGFMTWGLGTVFIFSLIGIGFSLYAPNPVGRLFLAGSYFLPIALAQALYLTKYVQHPWLWIVAAIAGTVVFAMSLPDDILMLDSTEQALALMTMAMTVYGLVMGAAMVWLLQHRKDYLPGHNENDTHPGTVVPRA